MLSFSAQSSEAIATAEAGELEEMGILDGAVLRHVYPWDADDLLWIEALHRRSLAEGGAGVSIRRISCVNWLGALR